MINIGIYILNTGGAGVLTLIAFLTCSTIMIVQIYEAGAKTK